MAVVALLGEDTKGPGPDNNCDLRNETTAPAMSSNRLTTGDTHGASVVGGEALGVAAGGSDGAMGGGLVIILSFLCQT